MPKYTFTYDKPLSLQVLASNGSEADEKLRRLNDKLLTVMRDEGFIFDRGEHIRVDESL
jgi:hypothetical protein